MKIDTPLLYNWSEPDIQEQANSFHERHYTVSNPESDKEFVLRFSGDFGLFKMMKDVNMSYKNLPLNVYESSQSFRYEKRGELSGLKRNRAFSMPDVHSFCTDIDQAWESYKKMYKEYSNLIESTGIDYAIVFRVEDSFYENSKDEITDLLSYSNRPALVEKLSDRKHYWVVKHEFQGIDSVGGNLQLSTVQLDVEDAERYGITYTDKKGDEKGCTICHSSMGSIERWMYSILEKALKGKKPTLPTWLSPTQVRVIPVNEKNIGYGEKVMDELNYRTDIDDKNESLNKKIRRSENEWIPYITVVGPKEEKNDDLQVRVRNTNLNKKMELGDLEKILKKETEGMPYRELNLPKKLSKRPKFHR